MKIENPERLKEYEEFLRLVGHRVVRTPSSLWVNVRPGVFQPAPPFHLPPIEKDEIRVVFKQTNAIACRWFSRRDGSAVSSGATTPMLYIARGPYDIALLPHNARHQTRRGLERVEVRRQDLDEATEPLAFAVYADTVRRLRLMRTDAQLNHRWQTWVQAIRRARGIEFWSGWHEGHMVAFVVTIQTPWGKEFVLTRSEQRALGLYPNNALIYTVTKQALESGNPLVSLGLSAYGGDKEGLHRFKRNLGFEAVALQENQEWHPLVRPFGPLLKPRRLQSMYRLISRATS